MKINWIVIRKCDDTPIEVYPFELEDDAKTFYESASLQWTEVFLCRVIEGPSS